MAESRVGRLSWRLEWDKEDLYLEGPELSFEVHETEGELIFVCERFVSFELALCKVSGNDFPTTPMEESTGSETSLRTARKWIASCLESHTSCSHTPLAGPLPTRLLDVTPINGGLDTSPPSSVCLRISSDLAEDIKYVTLSHCWGRRGTPTRLLSTNITSMMDKIEISSLPATFRDALTITKALGVRYIWIDSLCIIQDSPDDWRRESVAMDRVYKFALFNIAASAGLNSSRGCFSKRRADILQPIKMQLHWHTSEITQAAYHLVHSSWHQDVPNAPLNRRGWVLQERILSPRILHFSATQIYFECSKGVYSEAFPTRKVVKKDYSGSLRSGLVASHPLITPITASNANIEVSNGILTAWYNTISHYTKCKLTREEDKLVAISGLAREVQRLTGWEYAAGLWKERIEVQLLWYCLQGHKLVPKEIEYRAPTWSWASVAMEEDMILAFFSVESDAPSQHKRDPGKLLCEVVGLRVSTIGGEMSQVGGGFLEVKGELYPAVCGWKWNKARTSVPLIVGGHRIPVVYFDFPISNTPQDIWCLPVYKSKRIDNPFGIRGLVLIPVDGTKDARRYRRVGYFEAEKNLVRSARKRVKGVKGRNEGKNSKTSLSETIVII
ncbi:heterokaryon incompatibility protein-domain-containing protein [Tricladium varicosporioides]|nr:heterokaryon incompatibility protein-domain-containing protein [Hymenoscyphus varicosporioides]